MSIARYGARSAGFALLYLLALVAGQALDGALWPAAAVGAVWLVAQGAHGPRRFDALVMMVLAALVPDTDALLAGVTQALPQVLPAVLFAWLLDRWLPLYWQGLGERFYGAWPALGRLAGAAAVAGLSGAVLRSVLFPADFAAGEAVWAVLRDTLSVAVTILVVRAINQRYGTRAPEPRTAAPSEVNYREELRHRLDEVFAESPGARAESPRPAAGRRRRKRGDGPDGRPHLTIVK
ncbi:hypothetical protein Ade02nite_56070 [Paractinoplanes deccanensis]|uniref:Rod shape-determining protein MreD n=1 Tax=Paractinoplanes deccanensis TaxID=113561 RepID=A0ABQ3YAI8_9ACTN|nr:hypothetical protein [Actinoplanes deccanensis]GID76966.1 hypothetical protein Ade02nite_56070 [Actinoplanes deccanensis]